MISHLLLQLHSCCVGGSFAPNHWLIVSGISGNVSRWALFYTKVQLCKGNRIICVILTLRLQVVVVVVVVVMMVIVVVVVLSSSSSSSSSSCCCCCCCGVQVLTEHVGEGAFSMGGMCGMWLFQGFRLVGASFRVLGGMTLCLRQSNNKHVLVLFHIIV